MKDALVSYLLEILSKEAVLLGPPNDEQESLSSRLTDIRDILEKTEWIRSGHEMLEKIRDVAYRAEDLIDYYVAYPDSTEERGKHKWQRCFHRPGKQLIKTKRKIRTEIKEKVAEIRKSAKGKITVEGRGEADGSGPEKAPISVEADGVVGFIDDVQTLVDRLTSENSKRTAISIVGMAGLGKTTLAMKVYNHPAVKQKFELCAWVCVSEEDDTQKLVLSILKGFHKFKDETRQTPEDVLRKQLENYFKGKTYLIVLDDVRKREVWDKLNSLLPEDNNGSRILLTTRLNSIALITNPGGRELEDRPHYLQFLDKENSGELFRKKAFIGKTYSLKWEELGKQIAEKCSGLPLAIQDLGCLLRSERKGCENSTKKEAMELEVYRKWLKICSQVRTHLSNSKPPFASKLGLDKDYNQLSCYMKACSLYLSVFPEDYQISARQLMQLWVAEGLIENSSDHAMEETASMYLENFAREGLVHVVQRRLSGEVKTCCINPFYRDFCISEAGKEKFLSITNGGSDRRLVLINDGKNQKLSGIDGKNLRSLLCFTHMPGTSDDWSHLLQTTKFLKVLNVSHVSILPEVVGNLHLLRYLGLDSNSLQEIPSTVCNLPNLQVLDAKSKFLLSVPVDIWRLKKIRHIYFKGPILLLKPPTPTPPVDSQITPQPQPQSESQSHSQPRPRPRPSPRSSPPPSLPHPQLLEPPAPLPSSSSLRPSPLPPPTPTPPVDSQITPQPQPQPQSESQSHSQPRPSPRSSPPPSPPPSLPHPQLLEPPAPLPSSSSLRPSPLPPPTPTPPVDSQITPQPQPQSESQSHSQPRPRPSPRSSPPPSPPPSLPHPQLLEPPAPLPSSSSLRPSPLPPPPPPPPPRQPSFSKPQLHLFPTSQPPAPLILSSSQPHDDYDDDDGNSLKDLRSLSTISAESCTEEVFRKLPNLLKLGVIVKGYTDSLSNALVHLKRLHKLKLAGAVDFPPLLALPLKFPPNLVKLTLTETILAEDPMPLLGELETLEILKLSKNAYSGTLMVFSAKGFPKLKCLKLAGLRYIKKLDRKSGALPNLEQLVLHDCLELEIFLGLEHLTKLQHVDLKQPKKMLKELMMLLVEKHGIQLSIFPLD